MPRESCPVCAGRGRVPAGFYPDAPAGRQATCRSCGGRGTVPVEEAAAIGEPDANDLTYTPE